MVTVPKNISRNGSGARGKLKMKRKWPFSATEHDRRSSSNVLIVLSLQFSTKRELKKGKLHSRHHRIANSTELLLDAQLDYQKKQKKQILKRARVADKNEQKTRLSTCFHRSEQNVTVAFFSMMMMMLSLLFSSVP